MAKIKEIKDDAIIGIEVNKSYYLMVKALSFQLFMKINVEDKDQYLKELLTKEYKELDDNQRSLYTVILLLAEIESQATKQNLYEEKEINDPSENPVKLD
jgi:hypothetical protein